MPAATRLLPLRLPIGPNHASLTRRDGGTRPPATTANTSASSGVSASPKAAFTTATQVRQLVMSPSAAPSRL
jgi:hypothetical protein